MKKLAKVCAAVLLGAVAALTGLAASVSIPQAGGVSSTTLSFSSGGTYVFDGSSRPSWITAISLSVKSGSNTINLGSGKNTLTLASGGTATASFTASANTTGSARSWTYTITGPTTYSVIVSQSASSSVTSYTVTYKPGTLGTGTQQTQTKYQNVALTLKGAIFTRAGYTQTGWATYDGGTKVYALSASYTGNAALTLYPVWTASTSGLPNFVFYQVSGWPASAFLTSSSSGTSSVTTFKQGTSMYVRYGYINGGTSASATALTVKLYYDGTLCNTVTDDAGLAVSSGHSRWLEIYTSNMSAGTHTLKIVLNPGNAINESSYTDNEKSLSFTVTADEDEQKTETKNVSVAVAGGSASATLSFDKAGMYQFAGSSKPSWITGLSTSIKSGSNTINVGSGNSNISIEAGGTATVSVTAAANTSSESRFWTYVVSGTSRTYNIVITQPGVTTDPDPDPTPDPATGPDWNPVTKPDTIIVYARLYDKSASAYLESADGILAAFSSGGECRGKTTLTQGPRSKLFQLTVGIESSSETGLALKYWSEATGIVEIGETFGASASTIGSIAEPKTFYVGSNASEFTLAQGWTWVSVNVEPTDASFASVFKGVSFADDDVVKSSDGSATYYGGTWYPSPATFKFAAGRAYAVKKSTSGSATVKVEGTAAATSQAVTAGWNWIGATSTDDAALSKLTHSAGFTNDDVINSSSGSATYYGGTWYGDLKTLAVGVGYKAKFSKAGTISFNK